MRIISAFLIERCVLLMNALSRSLPGLPSLNNGTSTFFLATVTSSNTLLTVGLNPRLHIVLMHSVSLFSGSLSSMDHLPCSVIALPSFSSVSLHHMFYEIDAVDESKANLDTYHQQCCRGNAYDIRMERNNVPASIGKPHPLGNLPILITMLLFAALMPDSPCVTSGLSSCLLQAMASIFLFGKFLTLDCLAQCQI